MTDKKDMKLTVSSSPHVNSPVSTRSLMLDVLVALVPAMIMGVYYFGPRALVLTMISVLGCEIFEYAYKRLLHKPVTNGDCSAAVTGVLLAFVCPVALPYWTVLVGDFFAMFVVKHLFGGLGKNFLNPALAGRAFLTLSYPILMTTWIRPGVNNWWPVTSKVADAVSVATPMGIMHGSASAAPTLPWLAQNGATLHDLFFGNVAGCVGEVSAIALLAGGLYLIVRGVIHIRIPAAYLGTVAVITYLFPQGQDSLLWMLSQLCGGGLMLGAFFMATDYVTSPCTPKGELFYGIGCGLLTCFIRYKGGYPEGVSYAILLMNVCTPILEKCTLPKRFGDERGSNRKTANAVEKGGRQA